MTQSKPTEGKGIKEKYIQITDKLPQYPESEDTMILVEVIDELWLWIVNNFTPKTKKCNCAGSNWCSDCIPFKSFSNNENT